MAKACDTVVFKRRHKGGKVLPKSAWVHVKRCSGHKLKQRHGRKSTPQGCKDLLKREVKRAYGNKGKLQNAFYAYNACRLR